MMDDRMLFFDLESTGLDTDTDRVVELAFCDDEGTALLHSLVNPGRPIPPEVVAIHGISDEMVATAPSFADLAGQVQTLVTDATLVSYGGRAFDALMLDNELRRAGQPGMDLDTVVEIDLLRAWKELEPRTLEGALQRYLDIRRAPEAQHRAVADTAELPRLMRAMMAQHGMQNADLLVQLSRPEDECDRSRKFKLDAEGKVRFAFGKHDGELARDHQSYLEWMRDKGDFPADTMRVVRRIMRKLQPTGDR